MEPHVGSVRRPDQRGNDARQLRLYLLRRLHAHHALRRLGLKQTPLGAKCQTMRLNPEDRRGPDGPPRLDLHVGSLSLQRVFAAGSKPPLRCRSVPINAPKNEIVGSSGRARLCIPSRSSEEKRFIHAIHTTASLDLGSITYSQPSQNHLHFQISMRAASPIPEDVTFVYDNCHLEKGGSARTDDTTCHARCYGNIASGSHIRLAMSTARAR